MKNTIRKTLLAFAVTAVCAFGANVASAQDTLPDFTVDPLGTAANFTADQISGKYVEIANFNTNGTFDVSLYWKAAAFVKNDGTFQYDANITGLTVNYGVYALYTASGTFKQTTASRTDFIFTPGTGSLAVYLDVNKNSEFEAPTLSGDFTRTGIDDDKLLANGTPLYGNGFVDPALELCPFDQGNYCGSFGSRTTFDLTTEGSKFFIAPAPFYQLSFQSGMVTNFQPTDRQVINGSLNVSFGGQPASVPEPASIALLGLGLAGLGLSRGRKSAKGKNA